MTYEGICPMANSHHPPDMTRQCCLCRVRRCELSRPYKRVLRRSASGTDQNTERTCLAVGPTQFTPPHQTRQNSPVCVCLAWRCESALTGSGLTRPVQFVCREQSLWTQPTTIDIHLPGSPAGARDVTLPVSPLAHHDVS